MANKEISSIGESIRTNGALLAGFGVAMALALGITKAVTDGPIARSEKRIELEAVQQVLPKRYQGRELYNNDPYEDVKIVQAPWGEAKVYRARLSGTGTALAMQVTAPGGYSGSIKLLLGLTDKGRIISLRAVKNGHRETPGLGDKIETRKSDWITQFDGLRDDISADQACSPIITKTALQYTWVNLSQESTLMTLSGDGSATKEENRSRSLLGQWSLKGKPGKYSIDIDGRKLDVVDFDCSLMKLEDESGASTTYSKLFPWALDKDGGQFTTITSATVTSRAVVDATAQALNYFRANRSQLFAATAKQEPK